MAKRQKRSKRHKINKKNKRSIRIKAPKIRTKRGLLERFLKNIEQGMKKKEKMQRREASVRTTPKPTKTKIVQDGNSPATLKFEHAPLQRALKIQGKENKKNVLPRYVKTHVQGFDDIFTHGIPQGSAVLIAGGPGTGKTIFCLQALYNAAKRGEKCLYMSFEENEERLRQHMRDFGWDPEELEKKGMLMIKRFDPFDITRSVEALLTKAKKELLIDIHPVFFPENFTPTRIAVDSLSAVASAFVGREDSYRIYIEQLFRFFEELGATSFLITETTHPQDTGLTKSGIEAFLADGIVLMHNFKIRHERRSAIEVLKMRGEHFSKKTVKMDITSNKGIIVYPEQYITMRIPGSKIEYDF